MKRMEKMLKMNYTREKEDTSEKKKRLMKDYHLISGLEFQETKR